MRAVRGFRRQCEEMILCVHSWDICVCWVMSLRNFYFFFHLYKNVDYYNHNIYFYLISKGGVKTFIVYQTISQNNKCLEKSTN